MVEDFRAVLAELVKADARFMVVGAHALGVHGVPRATVDLDVWIDRSPENARRVWTARGRKKDLADLEALGES